MAMLATQLGAAGATLAWLFAEWAARGKPTVLGGISGAVAGLVAITPASGFVLPAPALLIGWFAFGPLSATPSAPEGVVGGLDQVVRQAIAIAATLAYSAVGTVVILLGVGLACGGLRVSGEAERAGLDEVLPGKRLA